MQQEKEREGEERKETGGRGGGAGNELGFLCSQNLVD